MLRKRKIRTAQCHSVHYEFSATSACCRGTTTHCQVDTEIFGIATEVVSGHQPVPGVPAVMANVVHELYDHISGLCGCQTTAGCMPGSAIDGAYLSCGNEAVAVLVEDLESLLKLLFGVGVLQRQQRHGVRSWRFSHA